MVTRANNVERRPSVCKYLAPANLGRRRRLRQLLKTSRRRISPSQANPSPDLHFNCGLRAAQALRPQSSFRQGLAIKNLITSSQILTATRPNLLHLPLHQNPPLRIRQTVPQMILTMMTQVAAEAVAALVALVALVGQAVTAWTTCSAEHLETRWIGQ